MSNDQPPPGPLWDYDDLLNLLSAERLGSYLNATEHNVELAFGLYEWSMRAAAEVMHTTGMVEVVVRNALDQQLTQWAAQRGAGSWLDTVPLDQRGLDDISKARGRATRFGRDEEVHGKVVAELSFGFWRFLVARRYLTSLWVPALGSAFSHCEDADLSARRDSVDSILRELNFVRNRAAHHEPMIRRDLSRDLHRSVTICSWVAPTAGAWLQARSGLADIVASRPPTAGRAN